MSPTATDKYFLAECWEKAMSQRQLNECAALQEVNSYQVFQGQLEEIHPHLKPQEWDGLTKAQADWETFRKSDCDFHASPFVKAAAFNPWSASDVWTAITSPGSAN
jgi:hypothetical protein